MPTHPQNEGKISLVQTHQAGDFENAIMKLQFVKLSLSDTKNLHNG